MVDSDLVNFILDEIKKGKKKEEIYTFLTVDNNLEIPKEIFEKAYIVSEIKFKNKKEIPTQDNFSKLKDKEASLPKSSDSKNKDDFKKKETKSTETKDDSKNINNTKNNRDDITKHYASISAISTSNTSEKKYDLSLVSRPTKKPPIVKKEIPIDNLSNNFLKKNLEKKNLPKKKDEFKIFKLLLIFFSTLLFLLILVVIILPLLNIDLISYFFN
jgi:hypothetical protein